MRIVWEVGRPGRWARCVKRLDDLGIEDGGWVGLGWVVLA